MSDYAMTTVNGVAARQLDKHRTRNAFAAVYAIPETGKGLIDDGAKLWQYDSPSAALAAWWDWLFSDEAETSNVQR